MENQTTVNLRLSAQRALLGMIYPEIRAITIGIEFMQNIETLKIICYLDRVPTEFDYQNIGEITGYILGDFNLIHKVEEICEYTTEPIGKLKMLDSLVYYRLES